MRGAWRAVLGLLCTFAGCDGESARTNREGAATGGAGNAGAGNGARSGSGGEAGMNDGGEGAETTGGFAGAMAGFSGASTGGVGGSSEGGTAGSGPCSCTGLTGVLPEATIECVNGGCVLDPDDCVPNRRNCDGLPENGCEARLDVDLSNCGTCGVACPNLSSCVQGNCQFAPCAPGYDRCADDNSCTPLDTEDDCGACDRRACAFENTIPTCSSTESPCLPPLCLPGYANCSGDNACETPIAASGTGCFPTPLTSHALDVEGSEIYVAVGGDGTTVVAGYFTSQADFDPTDGMDIRAPTNDENTAFISRYSPSGAYSWTLTLDGAPSWISRVAIASDGSIIAAGYHRGPVDLDPGSGESLQGSNGIQQAFVLALRAEGSFAWARSFTPRGGGALSSAADVALDAAGTIYVSGAFLGTVDFNPVAADGELVTEPGTMKPFVAKYGSSGTFEWVWSCSGEGYGGADRISVGGERIWLAGDMTGACSFDGTGSATTEADASGNFVLSLSGDRNLTSFALFEQLGWRARIASSVRSTFLVGATAVPVDLDPGPGVDRRTMPDGGAFAVNFAADGSFAWSQTLGRFEANDAVPTAAGGLLVAGSGSWNTNGAIDPLPAGVVLSVNADASPGFTLDLGANRHPRSLAAGGGVLAVAGQLFDDVGQKYFLARYAYADN